MLEVLGHRVLVKPDPLETKTESGILIAFGDKERLNRISMDRGTVVDIGKSAWKSFDDGHSWATIGDRVFFAKNAGKWITDPTTQEELVLLNDEDIQCRIRG